MQAAHAGEYWIPTESQDSAGRIVPFRTREVAAGKSAAGKEAAKAQQAEDRRAEFSAEALPWANDLFRSALRMTGDRVRAEDALQETFLQAWKSFGRFDAGTNCRAWLYTILFRCVSNQRRKWLRFPSFGGDNDKLETTLASPVRVPDTLEDRDILRALDRIPEEFRALVLLVDVEQFAYKEAAEILGIPIGTVMSRLSRGRKLLREQLADVARAYGIVKDKGQGA
jgi:RNA polymerase sigma-70 factor, ECF subfamily